MNNLQNINDFSTSYILYSYCKIALAFTKLVFAIKQAFIGKKTQNLGSVDIYLNCSGLYSRRGTNFCIRKISWWTTSVLVLGEKSLNHSQNKHNLCLLNCLLLQLNLHPTFGAVSVSLGSCCHIAPCCQWPPWQHVEVSQPHSCSRRDSLLFISAAFLHGR